MYRSSQKKLIISRRFKMNNLGLSNNPGARLLLIAVFFLSLFAGITSPAAAAPDNSNGAVYTLTNSPGGNEVLVFNRFADGSLAFQGSYATGGLGSGSGLGSQSAVVLSKNHQWLYAVNAGSNQISAFAVTGNGL